MLKDREYYLNHIDEFYELVHQDKLHPFQKELLKAMAMMDNGNAIIMARQNGRRWALDIYNELKAQFNKGENIGGKVRGYYIDEKNKLHYFNKE